MKPGEVRLGQSVDYLGTNWRVMGVYNDGKTLRLARPTQRNDGSYTFTENVFDDVPIEHVSATPRQT